jgi:chromosome segregation ATPase
VFALAAPFPRLAAYLPLELVQQARQIRRETDSALDLFVGHLLREADIIQKLEKGVAKYDRVVRLGDTFCRRKLPLERQSLLEQHESSNALFQHYHSLLREFEAAAAVRADSETLEREQQTLLASIRRAEKDLSLKNGMRSHLLQFAETAEEQEQLQQLQAELQVLEGSLRDLKRRQADLVAAARRLVQTGFPELTLFCLPQQLSASKTSSSLDPFVAESSLCFPRISLHLVEAQYSGKPPHR